ncbi:N-acetylmuramoyl-L-alanine amidase [Microlunatus flavus]|uniref:N-acetylmuramoyl-L-alanine amidase n=1 Tax=Microlunatus flavus TaxID=1036181 RepID=A0A1H8ZRK7_9ACTN|nr:N-acetylmuramoyl-L-alanine amidase [Microlunatus flavus]SEP66891.1 N-acetylmuramoyl-L-alanine amidase [Microlunatus flavus]
MRGRLRALGPVVPLALGVLLAGCGAGEPQARPPLPAPPQTVFSPEPVTPSPTPAPTPSEVSVPAPTPTTSPTPVAPTPTPTSTPRTTAPLIVVDPGHSGRSIRSTDRTTGLRDVDYPNYPEIYETFDVSACVAKGLRADGYRVTLTKRTALDSVSLAARARVANEGRAALAISVHDDHSQGPGFQATYSQRGVQRGGAYHPMYRGTGSRRTVFRDADVARASERAAATIARERTRVQGRTVSVRENSFTGRPPLEPGNLALVQLLAKVPWVYNEVGAKAGGSTTRAMSIATEEAYAKGLLVGVEAAVPLPAGRVAQPSAGATLLRGCLVTAAKPGDGRATRPARYRPAGS